MLAYLHRLIFIKDKIIRGEAKDHVEEINIMHKDVTNLLKKINECRMLLGDTTNVVTTAIDYDEKINQYHINIDGMDIYGNIGKIYTKKDIGSVAANCVLKCHGGNTCRRVLAGEVCRYYHDPKDLSCLLDAGIMRKSLYQKYLPRVRNYLDVAWTHVAAARPLPNLLVRNFGHDIVMDRARLKAYGIYEDQIELLKSQIMHDILVLKILAGP